MHALAHVVPEVDKRHLCDSHERQINNHAAHKRNLHEAQLHKQISKFKFKSTWIYEIISLFSQDLIYGLTKFTELQILDNLRLLLFTARSGFACDENVESFIW